MSKTYERDEQAELIPEVTRGRESIHGAAARLGVPLSRAYGSRRGRPAPRPPRRRSSSSCRRARPSILGHGEASGPRSSPLIRANAPATFSAE